VLFCVSKYGTEEVVCGVKVRRNIYMLLYARTTCVAACKSGPRAKAVDELGGDIEVLRWPQTCSSPFVSGCLERKTCGNAESDVNGVGFGCWEREICAWHADGVEELGNSWSAVAEKSELESGRYLLNS
jgi:hypothetical protein